MATVFVLGFCLFFLQCTLLRHSVQLSPFKEHRPTSLEYTRQEVKVQRYSRDTLLSLDPGAVYSATSCSNHFCQHVNVTGIHSHHLSCFRKPARRAHRGHRKKRMRHSTLVCNTYSNQSKTSNQDPSTSDSSISVALFNARSILGSSCDQKRDEIREFIKDNNLDLLFITETWLRETGCDRQLQHVTPPGYDARSFPRTTGTGGGIAVIFRKSFTSSISFNKTLPFEHQTFEMAQVTLSTHKNSINFFCVYRPPCSKANKLSDSMFYPNFYKLFEHVNFMKGSPIILGDINFHFNRPESNDVSKLIDLLDIFRFTQGVNQPTHEKGNILDWIMFRPEDNIMKSVSVSQGLTSDHFCIVNKMYASVSVPSPVYKTIRPIKKINISNFQSDLKEVVSNTLSADQLDSCLRETLDRHAPTSRVKDRSKKSDPWFPDIADDLRAAKQERRRAERKAVTTGLTVHKQIYNGLKRVVSKLINTARLRFTRKEVEESTSCRQIFNVCGKLCGRVKLSPLPTLYPMKTLPNMFCDFFVKKVSDLRKQLDMSKSTFYATDRVQTEFCFDSFLPISLDDLKKIILSSKPTTCPLDPIPTPLLFECIDILLPAIHSLINESLSSGLVPLLFKSAIVKPLLKKSTLDPNSLKNYRPVSNLPFLSKILEKVVLSQLFSYLNSHNLISVSQSAYRPFHSTETALVKVNSDILNSLDSSNFSILTLLDLSAAFDTIDHQILLSRLHSLYGISGSVLQWFSSYLSDRTLSVLIQDTYSDSASLSYGVPQGSVLGPVLFILYTKPLSDLLNSHSLSNQSFADDTQLYTSSPPDLVDQNLATIQNCILDVKQWMTDNKLKLNDDKTEALLFRKKTVDSNSLPRSVQICQSEISFSDHARNLGFTMSSDMSLDKHVSLVCRSAYFELYRISSIRQFLSVQITNTLICAYVLSKLDYCNALLVNCPQYLLDKLQRVQNAAARLVFRVKKNEHVTPLLKKLHWLPVEQRIKYKISSICFSFFNNTAPSYISDLLTVYTPSRTLRSSSDSRLLSVPRTNSVTYGERSFSFAAPSLWNSLPRSIRYAQSVSSFKRSLKTHLFSEHYGSR